MVICFARMTYPISAFVKLSVIHFCLSFLKSTPLGFRQKLANGFRKKSRQAQQFKSYEVMDVNPSAVQVALSNVDLLIHGHTHRANIHDVDGKKRIVLGDWKEIPLRF